MDRARALSPLLALALLVAALAAVPVDSAQAAGGACRGAKNAIVMISDGCGYKRVKAADYCDYCEAGRKRARAYEHFPVRLGMNTYEYEPVDGAYALLGYDSRKAWNEFDYVKDNATDSTSAASPCRPSSRPRTAPLAWT